jgi:hypothetical protein
MNFLLHRVGLRRGLAFGTIIIAALLAFEIFNYSTTEFALSDLLGDLEFAKMRWATILAIAFCGIDFAGIARLFTPEEGDNEPAEVWYLFGAWLLAATMNAMLTWWGVSLAILNNETLGNAVVGRETLMRVVPIFVAVLVWLIRVLIIGTFSVAGDRLFSQGDQPVRRVPGLSAQPVRTLGTQPAPAPTQARAAAARPVAQGNTGYRPAPKDPSQQPANTYSRPEPTYHPMSSMNARGDGNGSSKRSPLPPRR